ncbi:MAG: c-type cytochrome [Pseudomonadota bacterium]
MTLILLTAAACADKSGGPRQLAGADAERGRQTAERLACAACHEIPGVAWPQGRVGGSLTGFAGRPLIAGRFRNQPDVLVRWLSDAPSLDPSTGMPPLPITAAEARDVAAYLYTLK